MDFSRATTTDTSWGSGPVSQFVKKTAILRAYSCSMQIVVTSWASEVTELQQFTPETFLHLYSPCYVHCRIPPEVISLCTQSVKPCNETPSLGPAKQSGWVRNSNFRKSKFLHCSVHNKELQKQNKKSGGQDIRKGWRVGNTYSFHTQTSSALLLSPPSVKRVQGTPTS